MANFTKVEEILNKRYLEVLHKYKTGVFTVQEANFYIKALQAERKSWKRKKS